MVFHYEELFSDIRQFANHVAEQLGEGIQIGKLIGPFQLKLLWDKSDEFPEGAGLYAYSRPSGEVLYVGMGDIRARVWQHLGSPHNLKKEGAYKEQGFPKHRWGARSDIPGIQPLFEQGTMLVCGVSVEPKELMRLLEGYAIWRLKKKTGGSCLNVAD